MKFSKILNSKQKGNVLRASKGFTLIELLVVIGILAILLAITLIAINPARQFSQANDTKRRSDVNAILNAINQYMADNTGAVPSGITTTDQPIGSAVGSANICLALVSRYLAQLPSDPQTGGGTPISSPCTEPYVTNYWVQKSASDSRITVRAPATENLPIISVTR